MKEFYTDIPDTITIKDGYSGYNKIGLNLTKTGRILIEIDDAAKADNSTEFHVEYLKEEIDPYEDTVIEYNGLTLEIPQGSLNSSVPITVFNNL